MTPGVRGWATITSPDRSAHRWHVAPLVDAAAYHWGWLWLLVPLLFVGDTPAHYRGALLAVLALNFAHQALTVPCTYFDGAVVARDRRRCTVVPLLLLLGLVVSLGWWRATLLPGQLTRLELAVPVGLAILALQLDGLMRPPFDLSPRPLVVPAVALVLVPLGAALVGGVPGGLPIPAALATLGGLSLLSLLLAGLASRRGANGVRFAVFGAGVPVLLLIGTAALAAAPGADRGVWPPLAVPFRVLVGPIAVLAHLWNLWHVYMQKYGVLRIYAAKAGAAAAHGLPRWVDRGLVLGWLPLYFVVLGPAHREFLLGTFGDVAPYLEPTIDWLARHRAALVPPAVGVLVASLGLFLYHERRVMGMRNVPRLSMAAGTTALGASLLLVNPVKAVLAFGFGHVLEYCIFVWAYERRRHRAPRPDAPLLGHVFRHPAVAVGSFVALAAGTYAVGTRWEPSAGALGAVALFLGMLHFHLDGFVWKLGRADVREHL